MNVDYDLYEGETASGSVRHTYSRGTLVYDRGEIRTAPGHGRFVARAPGARGGGGMRLVVDADRVLADLRELRRAATAGPGGARRLAWSPDWLTARDVAARQARRAAGDRRPRRGRQPLGRAARRRRDAGLRDRRLAHRRGAVGRLAGRRARACCRRARRAARARRPATRRRVTVRLVDWADEEGARFGRSLLGSSAVRRARCDPDDVRDLRDAEGTRLQDALASCGVDLDAAPARRDARSTARSPTSSCTSSRARCCSTPAALASAVSGTFGDERYLIHFTGQAAHAGSTPMRLRRDALAAAATAALEIREVGIRHDGRHAPSAAMRAEPGVITAIAGETRDDARPAPPRRGRAGDDAATSACEACDAAAGAVRLRRSRRGASSAPTPTPFHPRPGRARARRGRGGRRRRRAADPERPAARRDGDRAARADRDDLRPVRPADLAHEDRGLPGGRRCGWRSRPTGARSARRSTRSPPASSRRWPHDGLRRRPADRPARRAGDRPRQARRGLRLHARVDVRLAPAVGGAVRHLQPDPRRDAQARSSARWSPTRRRATGRSPPRCSRRSTRCTATGRCAASAAATRRCASSTASRSGWPSCASAIGVIRGLANGEAVDYKGTTLRLAWNPDSRLRDLGRGLRAEGARAGRRGRRRLHPPARRPGHHRVEHRGGAPRRRGGRPRPRRDHDLRRRARLRDRRHRRGPRATRATSAAGSAGWSATTSPTSSRRYGADGSAVPTALTDYIAGREGYDYNEHGRAEQHAHRLRARRDRRPLLPRSARRRSTSRGCASSPASASTSSRSTSSTTRRTRRSPATASTSSRP